MPSKALTSRESLERHAQWRVGGEETGSLVEDREKDEGLDRGNMSGWQRLLESERPPPHSPPLAVTATEESSRTQGQVTPPWLITILHGFTHTHTHTHLQKWTCVSHMTKSSTLRRVLDDLSVGVPKEFKTSSCVGFRSETSSCWCHEKWHRRHPFDSRDAVLDFRAVLREGATD